jgi:hypothetical protein
MNEIELNNLNFRDTSKDNTKKVETDTLPKKNRNTDKKERRNPPSPQWAYAI